MYTGLRKFGSVLFIIGLGGIGLLALVFVVASFVTLQDAFIHDAWWELGALYKSTNIPLLLAIGVPSIALALIGTIMKHNKPR